MFSVIYHFGHKPFIIIIFIIDIQSHVTCTNGEAGDKYCYHPHGHYKGRNLYYKPNFS